MTDEGLAAELIARMERDQEARTEVGSGAVPDAVWKRVRDVDVDNTAWLTVVVDRHGWPRRSLIGEKAALAAWLLAQHADHDVAFQRRCLSLIAQAVRDGEADPTHLAYLTDRVLCAEGRRQRYATQYWYGPDGTGPLRPRPIEDVARLDERRHSVGLPSFAEYDREMHRRHDAAD